MRNYEMNNFISIIMLALICSVCIIFTYRAFQRKQKTKMRGIYLFMILGAFVGIFFSPKVSEVLIATYSVVGKNAGLGVYCISAVCLSVLGALTGMLIYSYIRGQYKKS